MTFPKDGNHRELNPGPAMLRLRVQTQTKNKIKTPGVFAPSPRVEQLPANPSIWDDRVVIQQTTRFGGRFVGAVPPQKMMLVVM
jgi:hypothetical protein